MGTLRLLSVTEKFKALITWVERSPVRALAALWLVLAIVVSTGDALTGSTRRDFTSYSLAAARTMYQGGNPYSREDAKTSYKYLPLNATLLWPFTRMPVALAQGMWTATNVVLLAVCLWAHRRLWAHELCVPWWVWAVALAVGLRFFVKNIRLGQWNTSVYCLSFLGLTVLYRGRAWLGGALLALAAALKYMPSFFVVLLGLERRWRAMAIVVLAYVGWVFVLPTIVHGPSRHLELLALYRQKAAKSYNHMLDGDYTSSLSLRSTVMRLTSPIKSRLPNPDAYDFTIVLLPKATARLLSEAVALVVFLATVGASWYILRRQASLRAESRPESASFDNPLGAMQQLLLIGLWYTMLLMISPETRTPHFLTLFTPAFALSLVLANWRWHAARRALVALLLGAATVFLLATAEISEKARYHLIASGLGAYAWAQVAMWLACLFALSVVSQVPRDSDGKE
jgi:hypothetical protein